MFNELESSILSMLSDQVTGEVITRSMFGARVLFGQGVPFGLTLDGAFYLRVGNHEIESYESNGYKAHTYYKSKSNHRSRHLVTTRYYKIPTEMMNPSTVNELVKQAIQYSKQEKRDKSAKPMRIKDLPNMQLTQERMLRSIGINDCSELREVGAQGAFDRLKKINDNLNRDMLYKLKGAIMGCHYSVIKLQENGLKGQ